MKDATEAWAAEMAKFRASPGYVLHTKKVAEAIRAAVVTGPGGSTEGCVQAIAAYESFVVKSVATLAVNLLMQDMEELLK